MSKLTNSRHREVAVDTKFKNSQTDISDQQVVFAVFDKVLLMMIDKWVDFYEAGFKLFKLSYELADKLAASRSCSDFFFKNSETAISEQKVVFACFDKILLIIVDKLVYFYVVYSEIFKRSYERATDTLERAVTAYENFKNLQIAISYPIVIFTVFDKILLMIVDKWVDLYPANTELFNMSYVPADKLPQQEVSAYTKLENSQTDISDQIVVFAVFDKVFNDDCW